MFFINYAANGTSLSALTAARTFFVIDNCKIVLDLDSTVRTSSLALAAGNTTVCASLSRDDTLVMIGAENLYI